MTFLIICCCNYERSYGYSFDCFDNASKENVVLETLTEAYPKLKIIRNKENIGFGRANNVAIEWAKQNLKFNFLLLLNNDTIVESDSIYYLKESFKIDSRIGITTGKILYESKNERNTF